jgi:hypothetical protein
LRYFFKGILTAGLTVCGALMPLSASAAPWAETGDSRLRADIVLLASASVLDDVTGQWPLPWAGILGDLDATANQPADVRAAARRVQALGRTQTAPGLSADMTLDVTNSPSLVYGFGGLGRGEGQTQLSLAYNSGGTSARIALGAITSDFRGRSVKFMPDGTFLAQQLGDDVLVYGGWLSHWWGPSWISSLSLSNSARPLPQLGIQRAGGASTWPVLSLLGPWQAEFFVGLLDDPRIDRNTVFNAMHLAFNPLPGLEIGLGRIQQICGENHPCAPLRDFIQFNNHPASVNDTSEQGQIDVRWSHAFFGVRTQMYMSLMNEDSSPFTHSGTSHLFAATVFMPLTAEEALRLTLEYTDSVPTRDMFSFGDVMHGFAYNNSGYPDGMRYRGRTLGFSLDSDSKLLSLQAAWADRSGRFYELSLHNAHISNPNNPVGNFLTTAPVRINMAEARVSMPWNGVKLDLALRLQDDQPRPQRGFDAGFEIALRAPL